MSNRYVADNCLSDLEEEGSSEDIVLPPALEPMHPNCASTKRNLPTQDHQNADSFSGYDSEGYKKCFDAARKIDVPELDVAFNVYTKGVYDKGPAYIFVHGAGFSGLSYGPLIKRMQNEAFCAAVDLRGHGLSQYRDGRRVPGTEFTVTKFNHDLIILIPFMLDLFRAEATTDLPANSDHTVVLFGHSLGGALVCHIANPLTQSGRIKIPCIVIIDISETVATMAIPNMQTILNKKPRRFSSKKAYVDWLLKTHILVNRASAEFSADGTLDANGNVIADLWSTNELWADWFKGMNREFISDFHGYRLLLISTMDKLDREHEISHMQGQLSIEVIPNGVHNLHEDDPDLSAFYVIRFLRRMYLTKHLLGIVFDYRVKVSNDEPLSMEEIRALGQM